MTPKSIEVINAWIYITLDLKDNNEGSSWREEDGANVIWYKYSREWRGCLSLIDTSELYGLINDGINKNKHRNTM